MSFERYDIYFKGEILPGQPPDKVRARIGKLFKANEKQLDRMFSGRAIRIKSGVDMDKAIRYRVMFRDLGALVDIKPVEPPAESAPSPEVGKQPDSPPLPQVEEMADFELLPAFTGTLEDCARPLEAVPLPDISALSLDRPGTLIDTRPPAPPAGIDTSGLAALPPNSGTLEDCHPAPEAVDIPDISGLKLVD